ncbi:hypothetical protein QR680_018545 [Steinernema hermaphroditum]|uniref:DEP domain-containing protein n=1 Tax=Steinernema hermaphroditum TaxID=289476 RepID=A0AA39HIA2_9BILA|nr:hypothetical protein QR680_018545 [Steinernema hermaphroditum]
MSSILNEEAEKNPQFKAVRQWNSIVRKFGREVPRKRHMKSFRSYESSFTGREAVDLLLVVLPGLVVDGNVVTREKCVLLLEKFLQGDIIRSVRDLSAGFDDSSELYVLSPASEEISREELSRPLRTPRRRNTAIREKVTSRAIRRGRRGRCRVPRRYMSEESRSSWRSRRASTSSTALIAS